MPTIYRQRVYVVDAVVWNQLGDHHAVYDVPNQKPSGDGWLKSGKGAYVYPGDVILTWTDGTITVMDGIEFKTQFEALEQ